MANTERYYCGACHQISVPISFFTLQRPRTVPQESSSIQTEINNSIGSTDRRNTNDERTNETNEASIFSSVNTSRIICSNCQSSSIVLEDQWLDVQSGSLLHPILLRYSQLWVPPLQEDLDRGYLSFPEPHIDHFLQRDDLFTEGFSSFLQWSVRRRRPSNSLEHHAIVDLISRLTDGIDRTLYVPRGSTSSHTTPIETGNNHVTRASGRNRSRLSRMNNRDIDIRSLSSFTDALMLGNSPILDDDMSIQGIRNSLASFSQSFPGHSIPHTFDILPRLRDLGSFFIRNLIDMVPLRELARSRALTNNNNNNNNNTNSIEIEGNAPSNITTTPLDTSYSIPSLDVMNSLRNGLDRFLERISQRVIPATEIPSDQSRVEEPLTISGEISVSIFVSHNLISNTDTQNTTSLGTDPSAIDRLVKNARPSKYKDIEKEKENGIKEETIKEEHKCQINKIKDQEKVSSDTDSGPSNRIKRNKIDNNVNDKRKQIDDHLSIKSDNLRYGDDNSNINSIRIDSNEISPSVQSPENIDNLDSVESLSDDICSICQLDLHDGRNVSALSDALGNEEEAFIDHVRNTGKYGCDHIFHTECIVPWLKKKNTCPVCRATLPVAINEGLGNDNNPFTENDIPIILGYNGQMPNGTNTGTDSLNRIIRNFERQSTIMGYYD